ncbi:MAG: Do family serine endopeptidase [Deltaproteobacteria bacterium]|jgi:serine protease Do|nr:Do family serine endopeptidase [Deltaproteobacteria bacterium]
MNNAAPHRKTLQAMILILILAAPSIAAASVSSLAESIRSLPEKLSAAELDQLAQALKKLPREAQAAIAPRADFKGLVKDAGPAVVNVSTERTSRGPAMPFSPFGEEFDFFFPFGRPDMMPRERRQNSLGSGFIISDDGYIVTNNHVVDGAEVIRVNFDSSRNKENSYEAAVIGVDKETDLALLKIEAKQKLPFIKFGDSDELEVGEWVVAIGNPLGLDHTVTAGILSAKFRNIDSSSLVRFLQTDASINPGNSGGPLLNMRGEVIGINTAIAQQAQGIGFAIPSSLAKGIIDDLKAERKVSRGWLGVTIQPVDAATAKALGLPTAKGALIGGIIPGQPAEKAGIEPGDVILKIDNAEINTPEELQQVIMRKKPGETVTALVWRDGRSRSYKIQLMERGAREQAANTPPKEGEADTPSLGLHVRPVNEQEVARLRLSPGQGLAIAQLDPDKLGAKAGLRRGDIILAVGRKPVRGVEDFNKDVEGMFKRQGAVILQINRGGNTFIASIETGK